MTELGPDAQRLLELARHGDDPGLGTAARVERSLAARIALGGAAGGSAIAASSAAKAAPFLSKALLPLALAGGVAGSGWLGWHALRTSPSASSSPSHDATSLVNAPVARPRALASDSTRELGEADEQESSSTAPQPVEVAEPAAERPDAPATRRSASHAAAKSVAPTQATNEAAPRAVEKDALQAETEALRIAQRTLRDGNAAAALDLLRAQDVAYARGSLQEERAAARILALCQHGDAALSRAEAQRFAKRWPRSALRARVLSACREP